MFWYILLAILPSLLGLWYGINCYDLEKKHHKKSYVFLCSAAIFFMIAFRNQSVGSVDSSTYYSLWETASGLNFAQFSTVTAGSSMEFGFLIFVWLFSRLFSSAQMLFILSGFFFAVSIGCYMYKYCCNPVLGYTMYITLGLYTFCFVNFISSNFSQKCYFIFGNLLYVWQTCKECLVCYYFRNVWYLVAADRQHNGFGKSNFW